MANSLLLMLTGVISVLVLMYIVMNVIAMAHFVTTKKQKRDVRLVAIGLVAAAFFAFSKLIELLPSVGFISWEDVSLTIQSLALVGYLGVYYLRLKHAKEYYG